MTCVAARTRQSFALMATGSHSAWQLSAEPMDTWVGDGRGGRFRPIMSVVVDSESGFCFGVDVGKEGEPPADVAGRVLYKTIRSVGPPPQVQVRDPELATLLRRREDLRAVEFELVEKLDAVDFMMRQMRGDMFPSAAPSLLDQPGMSVERLRAFADGCALFDHAAPWRELYDEDLIKVESPKPPSGMKFASVLGAGGQTFGIAFFPSLQSYDRMVEVVDSGGDVVREALKNPRWSFMFYGPDELPTDDLDIWQNNGLRVAREDSIPVLLRYRASGKVDRPDGLTITFVEGLCRAIATSSPAEFDSGKWEKTAQTFDGPVTFRLSMPSPRAPH